MLRIVVFGMGIAFVIMVFRLLISGKMSERASLPWIACSFFVIFLAVFPYSIDKIAAFVNIDYPPTLLFLISILIIFLLLLYQAIHISILQNKIRELAQTIFIINSISTNDTAKQVKAE